MGQKKYLSTSPETPAKYGHFKMDHIVWCANLRVCMPNLTMYSAACPESLDTTECRLHFVTTIHWGSIVQEQLGNGSVIMLCSNIEVRWSTLKIKKYQQDTMPSLNAKCQILSTECRKCQHKVSNTSVHPASDSRAKAQQCQRVVSGWKYLSISPGWSC